MGMGVGVGGRFLISTPSTLSRLGRGGIPRAIVPV